MKRTLIARIISIAAAVCLLLTVCACSGSTGGAVAKGSVDNLRWALDSKGCLSFTGSGAIPGVEYAFNTGTGMTDTIYPEWYDYREQITEVIIGSGIDGVSMNAFMYFPALREIDIAATVSVIDGYAVTGCTALERVTIRCASVEMEKYCIGYTGGTADSNLTDVVFVGAAGSQVQDYAGQCGARFSKL